jgi:hypothetical protein
MGERDVVAQHERMERRPRARPLRPTMKNDAFPSLTGPLIRYGFEDAHIQMLVDLSCDQLCLAHGRLHGAGEA